MEENEGSASINRCLQFQPVIILFKWIGLLFSELIKFIQLFIVELEYVRVSINEMIEAVVSLYYS